MGRDAIGEPLSLAVGGAWQGWDTKCSAELLAWHWLAVKLRFAGGTRETGATGCSGSTTRQAYMETWLIYQGRSTSLGGPPCALQLWPAVPFSLAAGRVVVRCSCSSCCGDPPFRFIRPLSTSPLGRTATVWPYPFGHTRPPGHHLGGCRTQTQKTTKKSLTWP